MNTLTLIVIISVLGPIIGSAIGVLSKPSKNLTFQMLSFAAGVMIAISFLELIPNSIGLGSVWTCVIGIAIGTLFMHLLEVILPHVHPEFCNHDKNICVNMKRTAIYLIIGIFMHNFPEGLAIAVGGVSSTGTSLMIAIAIAVQNVPEGICTSAPYYFCTRKKLKAFLVSSSTAIPILVGFLAGYFLFPNITNTVLSIIVGATAGIMIFISAHELIPSSSFKLTSHTTIFTFMAGVVFVILLGLIHLI